MKKSLKLFSVMAFVALAALVLMPHMAAAGTFSWEVTGPTEVQTGNSINLTLSVTASGSLNVDRPNPVFTIDRSYTIGGGSSNPEGLTSFTRTEQYNPQGKRTPDSVSGTDSTTLTLSAIGVAPGEYDVTITPTSTTGMECDPLSLTYSVIVTDPSNKPIVTINTPLNGSQWQYGIDIPISVSVDDQGSALQGDVMASLGEEDPFALDFDEETDSWVGNLSDLVPGSHTFKVSATNAAGTAEAESTFTVYVSFGQWLPPIVVSNKQMKSGSTLPVKFTIQGATGPLDDSVCEPKVLLDDVFQGYAPSFVDPETGLVYFKLEVKLPAPGSHSITVQEPNMQPTSVTKNITVR